MSKPLLYVDRIDLEDGLTIEMRWRVYRGIPGSRDSPPEYPDAELMEAREIVAAESYAVPRLFDMEELEKRYGAEYLATLYADAIETALEQDDPNYNDALYDAWREQEYERQGTNPYPRRL